MSESFWSHPQPVWCVPARWVSPTPPRPVTWGVRPWRESGTVTRFEADNRAAQAAYLADRDATTPFQVRQG